MIAQVAAEEKSPFNFPEYIAENGIAFNDDGKFWFAIVNEDIDIEGQEGIAAAHGLAHRNAKHRVDRLFGAFKEVQVIQSIFFQIVQVLDNLWQVFIFSIKLAKALFTV